MRVVFAGTPEFARVALERLHAAGFDIPLVLTQPDRPAGRGHEAAGLAGQAVRAGSTASPWRSRAACAWTASTPRTPPRRAQALQAAQRRRDGGGRLRPDPAAVGAGRCRALGCLNIHASLLPRWRGAAPIHRAIEAGDAETGVTIMQMDAGLDTGDMLLAERCAIAPQRHHRPRCTTGWPRWAAG